MVRDSRSLFIVLVFPFSPLSPLPAMPTAGKPAGRFFPFDNLRTSAYLHFILFLCFCDLVVRMFSFLNSSNSWFQEVFFLDPFDTQGQKINASAFRGSLH
jgi:hypothetical protein